MTGPLSSLRFHHMGLALPNDTDALLMLEALGYDIGGKVYDPLQNAHLRLCTSKNRPAVEIILPGNGPGPIDQIITKYQEMIYHTCYETDDLEATLASFDAAGLRCLPLAERKPAVLFGGRHVSFYRIVGWGIIELLENA